MKLNKIKVLYCEILLGVMKFHPISLNTVKYYLALENTERFLYIWLNCVQNFCLMCPFWLKRGLFKHKCALDIIFVNFLSSKTDKIQANFHDINFYGFNLCICSGHLMHGSMQCTCYQTD